MAEIIPFEKMIYKAIERSEKALENGNSIEAWIFFEKAEIFYKRLKKEDPKIDSLLEELSGGLDFYESLEHY